MAHESLEEEAVRIPIHWSDLPSHDHFAQVPPDILYHYTDFSGAKGIINSKSLWLTKLSYLNDRTELHHAIDRFSSAANRKSKWIDSEEKNEFLRAISDQLNHFRSVNICVASFCESRDLLSQWRAYGSHNSGIALGFHGLTMRSNAERHRIKLWKCIYNYIVQDKIIDELIEILINSYDLVNKKSSNKHIWERNKQALVDAFNHTFLRIAPIFKSHWFSEEKEWRLVSPPISNKNPDYCTNISNHRVTQYFNLGFHKPVNETWNVFGEIVIGPRPEPELAMEVFRLELDKADYKVPQIGHSGIPFRHPN